MDKKEVVANNAATSFYHFIIYYHFIIFNLKLFSTTLRLERAIRALARVGEIWKGMPKA